MAAIAWLSEQQIEGHVVFRVGRAGDQWVAEMVGVGSLRAHGSGTPWCFEPAPSACPEMTEKMRNGIVPALLRHLHGKLTLHAASVCRNGVAISCAGASRAGKSTAIAELCTRPGFELIADDATAIDFDAASAQVAPSESKHWLLPESRKAFGLDADDQKKRAVLPARVASKAARLVAVCSLVFDDGIESPQYRRLRGASAIAPLVGTVIRFAIDDQSARLREFEQLARLLDTVRVYEVRRPRRLSSLMLTGDVLERLLEEPDARADLHEGKP